jgi:LysM repeat protein
MPARGKSTFFFKVLMILTVHAVLIGGMLLQGCKDTKDTSSNTPPQDTTATSTADTLPPVSTAAISNAQAGTPQNPAQPTQPPPVAQAQAPVPPAQLPPVAPTTAPVTATTETREYVIASGDTLGAIARKNGIPLKALMDANAGVNPKKLQIGQKIQIPAGTGAATASAGAATSDTGDDTIYTVKSGDTLSKIAKLNHTTFKKIMALNDLKTTSIRTGQKLKLPALKTAETETPAATTAIVPLQPAPAPTTTAAAPTGVSSN